MNAFLTARLASLERRMNRRYIRFVCSLLLAVFLILQTISFATNDRGRTAFGPFLGADFAVFHVAGSIFNAYPPDRIYDVALHTGLYHALFPGVPAEAQLPYANAPFFVLPFALLAHLPYQWAYLVWVLVSIGLYWGGLRLLRGAFGGLPEDDWRTALLLAFSFTPFLVEGLSGGQVSVFGFFWLALALFLEQRGRHLPAGAALALLAYKPTLLLLILPMLVVTRRARLLGGFALGFLGLAALSLLAVGPQGCSNYLKTLFLFLDTSTAAESGLRSWKYVDINSFSKLLAGEAGWLRWGLVLLLAGGALPVLVRVWAKADCGREEVRGLVWGVTIAWTMVLNIYLGIYDTVLVVPAALIAADLFCRKGDDPGFPPAFKHLLLLLYLVPWVTQPVARLTGVQLYTPVLAGFGFYLIGLLRRATA